MKNFCIEHTRVLVDGEHCPQCFFASLPEHEKRRHAEHERYEERRHASDTQNEQLIQRFCSQIMGCLMRNTPVDDADLLAERTQYAMKWVRSDWLAEWKKAGEQGIDDFLSQRMNGLKIVNPCPADSPATFGDILTQQVKA